MKQISLLLGSGFSKPDGIKGVHEINNIFTTIKKELFDAVNFPHDNGIDYNYFVILINFYKENNNGIFDYEAFFDYVNRLNNNKENDHEVKSFIRGFELELKKNNTSFYSDDIRMFLLKFQLILAETLTNKSYFNNNMSLSGWLPYEDFINIINSKLKDEHLVHVHTLNHDLLFDFIGNQHPKLGKYFCDGFTDFNSDFFGVLTKSIPSENIKRKYKIPLKYFNNCFPNNLRLYKLHGSIDTHIGNLGTRMLTETEHLKQDFTRVKKDCFIEKIQKKIWLKELNKYWYNDTYFNFVPDFLTGKDWKKNYYQNDPYYSTLFKHFENNLICSEKLILIGYGGKDEGINEIINEKFIEKLICFDPKPSIELISLCKKHNTLPIEQGVENIGTFKNEILN